MMKVSKFKKPFYLGAIALFATTTLAVANPIVSHADDDNFDTSTHFDSVTQMYSVPSGLKSVTQKDGNGLSYLNYVHLDRNAITNSKLPSYIKNSFFGLSDGLANITKSTTISDSSYNQGYTVGQILYLAKRAAYNDSQSGQNTLPYTSGKRTDGRSDCLMDAYYYGYLDGRKSQQTNQIQQQYVPGVTPLENQFYQMAFYQGYTEAKNNVNPTTTNNQSPFGFDYNHIDGINEMLSYFNLPQVTKPAQYATLSNSSSIDKIDELVQSDGTTYSGGTYSVAQDIYGIDDLSFDSETPIVFGDESVARLIVNNTKANSLATHPIKADNSNKPNSHLSLLLNDTDIPSTPTTTTASSSNDTHTESNTNVAPIIITHHKHATKNKIKKVVKKHKTTKKHVVKKKVVKKHVTKATKKITKKHVIVKKHVSKKHVQKIRTHIPHTVYAKHRTGVHSVPQFNHGKTYYVAKGHKFHVYYKISDGHGNWRYNVGKHKFITTIPGSIGTKRVKKHVTHHKHHVVKHVLHKHHRR